MTLPLFFSCCSQLEKIIVAGYKALNLQYFFTGGPDEVKAWTIQVGAGPPLTGRRLTAVISV